MIEFNEDIDVQKPLQHNLRDLLTQVLVVVVSEVFPLVSILYSSSKASLTLLKGFFLGSFSVSRVVSKAVHCTACKAL